MASIVYSSFVEDVYRGRINLESDTISIMLVTDQFVPDKDIQTRRKDIPFEVIGKGYESGGQPVGASIRSENDFMDVILGQAVWPDATISAAGAVYYKSRGRNAANDELIAFIDFGETVNSTNDEFRVDPSTIRVRN